MFAWRSVHRLGLLSHIEFCEFKFCCIRFWRPRLNTHECFRRLSRCYEKNMTNVIMTVCYRSYNHSSFKRSKSSVDMMNSFHEVDIAAANNITDQPATFCREVENNTWKYSLSTELSIRTLLIQSLYFDARQLRQVTLVQSFLITTGVFYYWACDLVPKPTSKLIPYTFYKKGHRKSWYSQTVITFQMWHLIELQYKTHSSDKLGFIRLLVFIEQLR